MDQMKLFKSQSWNLKLDSINFVSKVANKRSERYMRSEIHDVQVSKAGCMSEYDGLDDVV